MLVPDPDGVLQTNRADTYLAEVPTRPRDFVLNGWLTTLTALHDYGHLRRSAAAKALFEANLATLRRMLDRFDAPALANSRYSLTSSMRARIELNPRAGDHVIQHLALRVPNEGTFPIGIGSGDRWSNHLDGKYLSSAEMPIRPSHGVLVANLVLSRMAEPEPIVLELTIVRAPVERVRLSLFVGRYSPLHASPVVPTWQVAAEVKPDVNGRCEMQLPWSLLDLVGYPTNFGKRVGAHHVNSFHAIHVERLRGLADRVSGEDLRAWADRWDRAMRTWPAKEAYRGMHVLIDSDIVAVEDLAQHFESHDFNRSAGA